MKIELHRTKVEPLARMLLAVALLLGALTFVKVAGFYAGAAKAKALAARSDPNAGTVDLAGVLAQAKASAEELKKKNLFVLSPPKQHPVNEVLGILGDEALIQDKWYKAGDSIGEAKIVAVEPTKVRIAWNGQEKEFAPIGAGGSGGPPGRPGSPPPRTTPGKPQTVVTGQQGPAKTGRGGPFLSPEEQAQLRSRWSSMSPEERQRARDEIRERLSRRER